MAGRHYTGDGGDGKGKEACGVGATKEASWQLVGCTEKKDPLSPVTSYKHLSL